MVGLLMLLLAPGPTIKLTVTPRMGMISPGECRKNGILVTARVHVDDPKKELFCPEITWSWGDDNQSTRQSDCDPDSEPASSYSEQHLYCTNGPMLVEVRLKSGKVTRTDSQTVDIR